jgi:hypothetical protein
MRTVTNKVEVLRRIQSQLILKQAEYRRDHADATPQNDEALAYLVEAADVIYDVIGDLRKMQGLANTFRTFVSNVPDEGDNADNH